MKKFLMVLMMVLGLGAAAFTEPVYVGEKVTAEKMTEVWTTYDNDFDWSTIENVEVINENDIQDFALLREDFNIEEFELGVTYTFYVKNDWQNVTALFMLQRIDNEYNYNIFIGEVTE